MGTPLERRRQLRREATPAEKRLWTALRNRRLLGLKFRRQHSVGPYIVDFICLEAQVIIEVDGDYHDYFYEYDLRRQRYLEEQGFQVIRFTNDDVMEDREAVMLSLTKLLSPLT